MLEPIPRSVLAMDAHRISRAITSLATEILHKNPHPDCLVIAGIPTRGVEIAQRLIRAIENISGIRCPLGVVDVAMHRDDISTRTRMTAVQTTELPGNLEKRSVVLVDDVLFTGRSCRAALDAIASFGRPINVQFAVLIDRGHRELPIQADYVGEHLVTSFNEKIRVRFENLDNEPDSVWIIHP